SRPDARRGPRGDRARDRRRREPHRPPALPGRAAAHGRRCARPIPARPGQAPPADRMTLTPASDPARINDLRMARVHLRMGLLTLARAELEDLYRREALDVIGLAVLAEARWRTGEGPAAAAAALAHLDAGG